MILLVDDQEVWAHLFHALALWRVECRRNGVAWPAELVRLVDELARPGAAPGGQERPTLGVGAGGVDAAPMMLTYEAAGARLGVSERTVRRLVASGRLPAVRVGRSVRIPVAALEEVA